MPYLQQTYLVKLYSNAFGLDNISNRQKKSVDPKKLPFVLYLISGSHESLGNLSEQ